YRQSALKDLTVTSMAGHSPYQRTTDDAAYSHGERIIGHLDKRFSDQGGMIPFLKEFAAENMYTINTTQHFQKSLEAYFKADLKDFFSTYIYNKKGGIHKSAGKLPNKYHPRLTKQELLDLL